MSLCCQVEPLSQGRSHLTPCELSSFHYLFTCDLFEVGGLDDSSSNPKHLHWAPTRIFPFNNNHRRGQSGRGAQRGKCPLVQKADVRSWPTSLSSLNPCPWQDDFAASPLKHCCNFHSHYNFPPARGAPRCFSSQDSPASSLRIPEIPGDPAPSGKGGYSIST